MRGYLLASSSGAACVMMLFSASVAGAQSVQAPTASEPAVNATEASQSGQIADILVTATRRSESMQRVPIPITVQTAESLAAAGARSIPDVGSLTPGLQFVPTGAATAPYLRGVGASTTAAGAELGVALYIDDVYIPFGPALTIGLNNVASVAVLRGPQGTLFGRNATAGVLQITSRKPGQTQVLDATIGYGNHDTTEANLYASTPLSPRVAADIALAFRDVSGGWGTNIATGENMFVAKDFGARSRWEVELGPQTQVTAIGQYYRTETQAGFGSTRLGPGELGQNERYSGGVVATEGFYDTSADDFSGATSKVYGGSLRIVQGLDFGELRSITAANRVTTEGYVDFDFGNIRPGTYVHIPQREYALSQELQLASNADQDSRFKWVTGIFLYRNVAGYKNQKTTAPAAFAQPQILNTKQYTSSYSAFGEGTFKLSDATNLTAGVRYNIDKRRYRGSTVTFPLAGGSVLAESTGQKTFKKATYKVALDHELTSDIMAYLTYSTGFKSGFFGTQTIQTVPGDPTKGLPVDQENLRAIEAGLKTTLFDRRVRLNLSAFHYDYSDLQLNAFLNQTTRVVLNVKGAEIYGLDVEGEWRVADGFSLTASAEYLHARYTDFTNAPFFTPRTVAPFGLIPSIGNANGNHVVQAPEFTATVGANYSFPLAGGKLNLNATGNYNSGYYFEPMNRLRQPSFLWVNSSATWTSEGGRYEIGIWGRNLTDRKVYGSVNPTAGGDAAVPREPLTFGGRVGVHF